MSDSRDGIGQRLFYVWRIVATGFSFAVFYLSGFLVTFTVIPVLKVISPDRRDRHRRGQTLNKLWFRTFAGLMKSVGVIREITVEKTVDPESGGPYIILANHPTLIDVVALVAELEAVDCVVKMDVWDSWAMGSPVRNAGYIPDRSGLSVYETCLKRLEEGRSILFFPEGTRSPKGGLRDFSKVAAQVALGSSVEVLPVVIETNVSTLRKEQSWYDVPEDPLEMQLTFHEPVRFRVEDFDSMSQGSQSVTEQLEGFFEDKLGYA